VVVVVAAALQQGRRKARPKKKRQWRRRRIAKGLERLARSAVSELQLTGIVVLVRREDTSHNPVILSLEGGEGEREERRSKQQHGQKSPELVANNTRRWNARGIVGKVK
jgi:hypothetical protein